MRRLTFVLPFVALLTLGALTGCRTEPSVAAYVGEVTISTDKLADAVAERMADPNIAAVVEPGDPDYQRVVLFQLVRQEEYRLVSAEYDVNVADRDIQGYLDDALSVDGAPSATEFYVQQASDNKRAEVDVREVVRQILIRVEVAAAEGLDGPTQDAALRQRYEEIKNQLSTIELGVITVPDQAAAEVILAALLANPGSYPDLAAAHAGPNTLPTLSSASIADVPAELLPSVLQTVVGQGFTVTVPGGIAVGYVSALDVPPFEDVEDQVRAEAATGVDAAAQEVVRSFVADLDIDINPRYGSLDEAEIVPDNDGDVVRILEDTGTT